MRTRGPSLTARFVALMRSRLERPEIETGDADAERRLYEGLRLRWNVPIFGGRGRATIAERTAFFDDETLLALRAGVTQIVIVGAGYDGRALRFKTPGARFFEVDHPLTQADKRQRLGALGVPLDHVRFVPIDLVHGRLEDALGRADHRREDATLFVCEGLVRYLPKQIVERLFASMRARAAAGSTLVLNSREYRAPVRMSARRLFFSFLGEPVVSTFAVGETAKVLRGAGWTVAREVRRAGQKTERILVAAQPMGGDR